MFIYYFIIVRYFVFILNVVKFFFSDFRSFEFLVPEDLSITRIAGLSWDQWSSQIGLPLVTQLREGIHPLLFPTDLTVNPIASVFDDKKSIKLLSPVSIFCIDFELKLYRLCSHANVNPILVSICFVSVNT